MPQRRWRFARFVPSRFWTRPRPRERPRGTPQSLQEEIGSSHQQDVADEREQRERFEAAAEERRPGRRERDVAVELVGVAPEDSRVLAEDARPAGSNPYGDGRAAARIVATLLERS